MPGIANADTASRLVRHACYTSAMLALALTMMVGGCSPAANANTSTPQEKARVRTDVAHTFGHLGASPIIIALAKVIVIRESWGGEVAAVHTRGAGELGFGPMGLGGRANRDKWPGDPQEFCDAQVSAAIAHEIMWRAVDRWGATNAIGIQAIYARGVGVCGYEVEGELVEAKPPPSSWRWSKRPWVRWLHRWMQRRRECRLPTLRRVTGLCSRLRAQGYDCRAPISEADLGRRFDSSAERAAWVASNR